jgi:hypothetical protein
MGCCGRSYFFSRRARVAIEAATIGAGVFDPGVSLARGGIHGLGSMGFGKRELIFQ